MTSLPPIQQILTISSMMHSSTRWLRCHVNGCVSKFSCEYVRLWPQNFWLGHWEVCSVGIYVNISCWLFFRLVQKTQRTGYRKIPTWFNFVKSGSLWQRLALQWGYIVVCMTKVPNINVLLFLTWADHEINWVIHVIVAAVSIEYDGNNTMIWLRQKHK